MTGFDFLARSSSFSLLTGLKAELQTKQQSHQKMNPVYLCDLYILNKIQNNISLGLVADFVP